MLWELFSTFFIIGCFSFGGGYAMISFIQKQAVLHHHWITMAQFTDIVAVAGSAPGPLAVNATTYVGYQAFGLPGAIIATLGIMLPAFIIVIALASFLTKNQDAPLLQSALQGLKPVVVALIAGAAISLGMGNISDLRGVFLGLAAFGLSAFTKVHPIFIILGFGLLGILIG